MSASPSKKQPKKSIHEFFKPYLKSTTSTVPAKRPSPSIEEAEEAERSRRDESKIATPKFQRRKSNNERLRTPGSSARSPFSAPGSRASLSIRSRTPHVKTPIDPPSTYKRASIFSAASQDDITPKLPATTFSFADLPSSTQAVVKNGKVIEIRDSDEDDTESLESLDDIFDRKKGGHTTSLSSTPGEDEAKLEAERVKTLSMFTNGRSVPLVGKDKIRELRAKENAFKFDLASLIGDHFDDEEVETNVRKARANVDAATKAANIDSLPKLDKKLLATVATTEDGEHGVARLMDAVDRTEALSTDSVFLFFGVNGLNDWQDEDPFEYPFPGERIPENLWRDGDNEARSRGYTSGHMAGLAARRRIHDEALNWTFENVVLERQDEVRQSYIECLRNASPSWTRTNVTAQDVQTVFQTLGADNNSLHDSIEIKPRHQLFKDPERRDPRYLLAALDLFQSICGDMDFAALSKLTSMMCRLAIDAELMSDSRVCSKVEEMLEALLSLHDVEMRTHVVERMLADVGHYLKDATLQAHLLAHIVPTSLIACRARVLLAQVFLLGRDVLRNSNSMFPKISLDILTLYVSKSPDFDTRRRKGPNMFDYVALRARVHILDIAISDGGRPATFALRTDEHMFNKSVDRLADAIHATQVAITDTGASHMTRTEAKDDLRALHARLLYSVRTEVRPKRHIFDGKKMRDAEEIRVEEQGKDFMKRFLEKRMQMQHQEREMLEASAEDEDRQADDERLVSRDEKSISSSSSSARSESEKQIRRQLGIGG